MTNQSTIDKLIEMHMTPMADAFRIQMNDTSMKEVPFEDRFGMLVDHEYTERKNKRLKRLIRNAEFEQPDACIAAVDYGHNRKVNRTLVERLATCEYITEYRNIFITGATGIGKLIWLVHLAWKPASIFTPLSMFVCQTCFWIFEPQETRGTFPIH